MAAGDKRGSAATAGNRKTGLAVFVGTRKGAWILRSDGTRRRWALEGPHFLGSIVHEGADFWWFRDPAAALSGLVLLALGACSAYRVWKLVAPGTAGVADGPDSPPAIAR